MATAETLVASDGTRTSPVDLLAPPGRLVSLDAFRGITIAGMILVNDPGTWSAIYDPLEHAEWHGWTPTDLVFPFFLFIVGVAITFTYRKRLDRGEDRRPLVVKALRRTLVLIGIGLLLAAFPFVEFSPSLRPIDLSQLRFPGVLQRIAVCYFAATLLFLYTPRRTQVAGAGALLLGYWALMTLVPVPGYGAGMIDQPEATLAAHLDRVVLGTGHLWEGAGRMWDPEGLLSTLPAIVTALIGVWAGHILLSDGTPAEKTARLFAWGLVLLIAGYAWDWFFPINKKIWTSSYTVFTGGLGMSTLALCYWAVDVQGYKRWARPFVVYGVNAIGIYVLSGLLATLFYTIRVPSDGGSRSLHQTVYQGIFEGVGPAELSSLLFALTWVAALYLVAYWMYRRRIFLKV